MVQEVKDGGEREQVTSVASWLPSPIIAGAAASALASSLVIWREAGEGARKGGAV